MTLINKTECKYCKKEIKDGQLQIQDKDGVPYAHYECFGKQG